MRGAYWNHGSKDAGPDPDWDMKTGTWNGNVNRVLKQQQQNQAGEDGNSASGSSSSTPLPPSMLFNPTPEQVEEHRRALEKRLRDAGLKKPKQEEEETAATTEMVRKV